MDSGPKRTNFASGSPWEPLRGYSRAVKVGDHLFISGTTALNERGEVVGQGNAYEQTRYIIDRVKRILAAAGFQLADVVRTRLFVTRMGKWEEYAMAHHEAFEPIRPASSIVEVVRLVDPRLMVEMEVDAIRGAGNVQSLSIEIF
jgi:enamine deaminase RidA (YjgF/YER057c/UK114 family)